MNKRTGIDGELSTGIRKVKYLKVYYKKGNRWYRTGQIIGQPKTKGE